MPLGRRLLAPAVPGVHRFVPPIDMVGTSFGIGSLVAATTFAIPVARRRVTVLVGRDLFVERRGEVCLTTSGRAAMEAMLRAVSRSRVAI